MRIFCKLVFQFLGAPEKKNELGFRSDCDEILRPILSFPFRNFFEFQLVA